MMKRPFFMPKIPSFLIRLMLGEAAGMVLGGSRISVKKFKMRDFHSSLERWEKPFVMFWKSEIVNIVVSQ